MRIQHNIMAMNAYRNYNTNTKALSGNLEKLSSGYKINRAGDDAAGLAISEKMRAQITGLDAAQKNVKDGISLVKTGEGAMQEIQDMLNRMDYLATQSANGTYDNEVDRANLQKEVNNLKTEINRIADSANFNGIKLLDGSLAGSSGGGAVDATATAGLSAGTPQPLKQTLAWAATPLPAATLSSGDKVSLTITMDDGASYSLDMEVTVDATNGTTYKLADGTAVATAAASKDGKAVKADLDDVLEYAFTNIAQLKEDYKFTKTSGLVEANESSFDTPQVASVTLSGQNFTVSTSNTLTQEGKGSHQVLDTTALTIYDGTQETEDVIFTVDGKKFALAKTANLVASFDSDVSVLVTAAALTDASGLAALINQQTGLNVKADGTTKTNINLYSTSVGNGGGLTLQIGDSSDKFNQMVVKIGDMHTKAMGTGKTTLDGTEVNVTKTIADIDIGTQEGAQEAVAVIKNAINYVSGIRGDLGAIQNRLDHTANNLSVMAENIQDAESTIRDTDVANEMMSYVKNNILVQSAQAMLAQANQVPQGVLQLLG